MYHPVIELIFGETHRTREEIDMEGQDISKFRHRGTEHQVHCSSCEVEITETEKQFQIYGKEIWCEKCFVDRFIIIDEIPYDRRTL